MKKSNKIKNEGGIQLNPTVSEMQNLPAKWEWLGQVCAEHGVLIIYPQAEKQMTICEQTGRFSVNVKWFLKRSLKNTWWIF